MFERKGMGKEIFIQSIENLKILIFSFSVFEERIIYTSILTKN